MHSNCLLHIYDQSITIIHHFQLIFALTVLVILNSLSLPFTPFTKRQTRWRMAIPLVTAQKNSAAVGKIRPQAGHPEIIF
jgi:hypothetical protein